MSGDVYVLFTLGGHNKLNWFLHPLITHCDLLIPCNGRWILYGKGVGYTEVSDISNIRDIINQGFIVKARPGKATRGLFMLNTCVGLVKNYLGIRNPFILTPYQLYRHLRKESWAARLEE